MMAGFINTIDSLGDMATADAIVSRTITEFCDDALTSIGNYTFYDCNKLTRVDLPNVTSLGKNAFCNCSKLTSLNLPNVTSIGEYAFHQAYNVTSIDLSKVTSIGNYAFNVVPLTSIDLSSVTTIGDRAFGSCSKLVSVRLPATPPTLTTANTFSVAQTTCVFYIPTGSLSAYQSATNWSSLTSTYSFVEEDR